MKYYVHVLKNYANFSGRARRSEYWYFVLFNIIASILVMLIDNMLGTTISITGAYGEVLALPYGYIFFLYTFLVLLPGLAVSVRRLHDVNKSGWFYLICLIPLIGSIWLLVLFCTEGDNGPNQYGPDPKGQADEEIDQLGSYLTTG